MKVGLTYTGDTLNASVELEGSKSISNRLLIMRALSKSDFEIKHLSPSDDTQTLLALLKSDNIICDVGAAGTTMRFLTAFFALQPGLRILTGSERMKKRPIHILVDALRELGAEIEYKEKEGFPPLKIEGKHLSANEVHIKADVSSQYISALMMIAPVLENGLTLHLEGKLSSFPYISMTLRLMQSMGIECSISENIISIAHGNYNAKNVHVEGDWSAASYYFSIVALSENSRLRILGIDENSLQGDAVLPQIYKQLGVTTNFNSGVCELQQTGNITSYFDYDFSNCPDLAQTVVVTCAALGIPGKFSGLESLKIKETDRTNALATELKKFDVNFSAEGNSWILDGKISIKKNVEIETYEDHRMAMCFAPLALLQPIIICDKDVVKKSYPSFWDDLVSLDFTVSSIG